MIISIFISILEGFPNFWPVLYTYTYIANLNWHDYTLGSLCSPITRDSQHTIVHPTGPFQSRWFCITVKFSKKKIGSQRHHFCVL